jgi:hypothetical protein
MAKSQQPKQAQRRELTIGHLPLPFGIGTNWRELDQQLGLLLEDYLRKYLHNTHSLLNLKLWHFSRAH